MGEAPPRAAAHDVAAPASDAAAARAPADAAAPPPDTAAAESEPASLAGRKLIREAEMTLVVEDLSYAMSSAQKLARELDGYLERQRGSTMVIRVPAGAFRSAVARFGGLGSVVKKEIRALDVTERYMDLETRLANAKALAARLRGLLEKATTVKDALLIEKELARVQTDIDRLAGQLKLLASQVTFATITLNFHGAVRTLPAGLKVKLPFPWLHELGVDRLLRFGGRAVYR
jgi:hypothetical protein